jgi:hypothetical protein
MKYFNFLFLLLILFTGCSTSNNHRIELSRDVNDLKSAPNEIIIESKSYSLEAYIWRDFIPSTDSTLNRGLMAVIKIKTVDSSEIPVSLNVSLLWILNKNNVWETKPVRTNLLSPDIFEVFISGGPAWDKGIKTDVVVEIKHNNKIKLLGIKNQEIHTVY